MVWWGTLGRQIVVNGGVGGRRGVARAMRDAEVRRVLCAGAVAEPCGGSTLGWFRRDSRLGARARWRSRAGRKKVAGQALSSGPSQGRRGGGPGMS